MIIKKVRRFLSEAVKKDIMEEEYKAQLSPRIEPYRTSMDVLFDIFDGKGNSEAVSNYLTLLAHLTKLKKNSVPYNFTEDTGSKRILGHIFIPQKSNSNNLLGLGSQVSGMFALPYENLTPMELALTAEVVGVTSFAKLIPFLLLRNSEDSKYPRFLIIEEFLADSRVSDQCKLAVACFLYTDSKSIMTSDVSGWLVTSNKGRYIPEMVKLFDDPKKDDKERQESRNDIIHEIISSSLRLSISEVKRSDQIEEYLQQHTAHGNAVLAGLSEEVVTKEFLDSILTLSNMDSPKYSESLAPHIRRLYDFPEEMPAEWAMKAIL